MPAAPIPQTTTLVSLIGFPTIFRALIRPAYNTTAVPCWSSWNTGISSSSRSRCSISKHRGRGNILQVNAAEAGRDRFDRGYDLLGILRVQANREGIHVGQLLEQHRFAFHYGHRGKGTYIAKSQDGASVGDDGNCISLDG